MKTIEETIKFLKATIDETEQDLAEQANSGVQIQSLIVGKLDALREIVRFIEGEV